jgi:hypothetical protein
MMRPLVPAGADTGLATNRLFAILQEWKWRCEAAQELRSGAFGHARRIVARARRIST